MGWRNRPNKIEEITSEIDYVLFIDESGLAELKNIRKRLLNNEEIKLEDRYFIVTGVLIHKEELQKIAKRIVDLKSKHWPPTGMAKYKGEEKRVCFHSYEIRKRRGPFASNILSDYESFMNDLTEFLSEIDVKVFSTAIDKKQHYLKYSDPHHPYKVSMEFLLERVYFHIPKNSAALVVLEGRGKKDDKELLKQITKMLDCGTRFITSSDLEYVKGVYFNDKWSDACDKRKSYFGLEIADLFCFPIAKYTRTGVKDAAFLTFEKRLYGYPNYARKGYKKFP